MSFVACKYHPHSPARWCCDQCDIDFCGECVKLDLHRNEARCSKCGALLEQHDASNFITPFWQRLPQFFKYPLALAPLIFLLLLSVLLSVLAFGTLLSWIFYSILLLAFTSYTMQVLERSADGHLQAPPINTELFTSRLLLPLKLIMMYLIMMVLVGIVATVAGEMPALLLGFIFLLGLPAAIMMITIDNDLLRAINPVVLVGIMKTIGAPYLLLYLFLILLAGGSTFLEHSIEESGIFLLTPISWFISLYYSLVMFNMMGYTIFQYHEELGHDVVMFVDKKVDDKAKGKERSAQSDPVLAEANVLIREGELEQASHVLRDATQRHNPPTEHHALYHKVLMQLGKTDLMLEHGISYLHILINNNQYQDAARLAIELIKEKNDFKIHDPDQYFNLASAMERAGGQREAVLFLNGFHSRHPGHPDIPRLYLLAARLLSDRLHKDKQAHAVLQFLLKNYPEHPLRGEVQSLSNVLQQML